MSVCVELMPPLVTPIHFKPSLWSVNTPTSLSLPPPPPPSLSLPSDLSDPVVRFAPFECIEDGGTPYFGSTVIINCIAEGEPFPQITWFYMYSNVVKKVKEGEERFLNVRLEQNNSRLIIDQLAASNVGNYECRSENVIGQRSAMQYLGYRGMM